MFETYSFIQLLNSQIQIERRTKRSEKCFIETNMLSLKRIPQNKKKYKEGKRSYFHRGARVGREY